MQKLVRCFKFHIRSYSYRKTSTPCHMNCEAVTKEITHIWQVPRASAANLLYMLCLNPNIHKPLFVEPQPSFILLHLHENSCHSYISHLSLWPSYKEQSIIPGVPLSFWATVTTKVFYVCSIPIPHFNSFIITVLGERHNLWCSMYFLRSLILSSVNVVFRVLLDCFVSDYFLSVSNSIGQS